MWMEALASRPGDHSGVTHITENNDTLTSRNNKGKRAQTVVTALLHVTSQQCTATMKNSSFNNK